MKKILSILLTVILLAVLLLTGCNSSGASKRVSKEKGADETQEVQETLYSLDVERYEAYVEVLEDIIEDEEWPDGTNVLEEGFNYGYMGDNSFAMCDVDLDGNDELLVEITTTSMAGMEMRMFDYDAKTEEVVEQWVSFPGVEIYDNGILILEASHNHTGCDDIWPFTMYRYDKKTDKFEDVGAAYGASKESIYDSYKEEDDSDRDGIIYYVSDESTDGDKPCTATEYQEWLNKYLGESNNIYIPWENMYEGNVEKLDDILNIKGAVKPIPLAYNKVIKQYDLNSDGENDELEITCEESEYSEYGIMYGTEWCVYINGEEALKVEPEMAAELEVYLYRISDKRSYLYVKQNLEDNNDIMGVCLYHVEGNSLVENQDFYNFVMDNIHAFHTQVDIAYMTGDFLKVLCSNQFNATAWLDWEMDYEYKVKKDCWETTDEIYTLVYEDFMEEKEDGMTANQEFTVYKDYDSDKVAYVVKRGDVIKLDAIRFHDGQTYFRAKNEDGKTGWFADPEESSVEDEGNWLYGYFEEAQFSG